MNVKECQQEGLTSLAELIAEFINDYGFARIYVADKFEEEDDDKLLGTLYITTDEGGLADLVAGKMYIEGRYTYSYRQLSEREWNLYMEPSGEGEDVGRITAADVWDWFYQDDEENNVTIRAYAESTDYKEILELVRKEVGDDNAQDNKCIREAKINNLTEETDENMQGLYYAEFLFEGLPLGAYKVAMYKPGYPIKTYDLVVEVGGVSLPRAYASGSWWFNPFGDVDSDWHVNVGDLLFMERYNADWGGAYREIDLLAGDIDGNGEIDLKDILLLEKHIAGCEGYEDLSSYCKAS